MNATMTVVPLHREALSIEDVQAIAGISRATIYRLMSSGVLKARKIGKRTVIMRKDLMTFLDSLTPISVTR